MSGVGLGVRLRGLHAAWASSLLPVLPSLSLLLSRVTPTLPRPCALPRPSALSRPTPPCPCAVRGSVQGSDSPSWTSKIAAVGCLTEGASGGVRGVSQRDVSWVRGLALALGGPRSLPGGHLFSVLNRPWAVAEWQPPAPGRASEAPS